MFANQSKKSCRTGSSSLAQRGLSIVEIMIILAVVGLVLGASIVPLNELINSDSYKQELRKINTARAAIIGYAANHQTVESTVYVIGDPAPTNRRRIVLPAGRPYLPCPDVDGDGYEDRQSFDVTGEVLAVAVDSLTVSAARNDLLQVGNCALSRGTLPWKTLGVPPADGWGNRYTYQVDDVYSNALIGFGQNSKVDSFDVRRLVTVNAAGRILFQRRNEAAPTNIARDGVARVFQNHRHPSVVCRGDVVLCQEQTGVTLALESGQQVTAPFTAPRRDFDQLNDIIEGLPYVLVSHGKNGRGAVNHHVSVDAGASICNAPVRNSTTNSTAIGGGAIRSIEHYRHEIVNFPFLELGLPDVLRYCRPITGYHDGYFVHQARADEFFAGVSNDNYDDIVVWMTRQELLQEMTRAEIFPVNAFPVLRSY